MTLLVFISTFVFQTTSAYEYTPREKEMSMSSSRIELHAIDSPVLSPVDSISVPSEPPDIRNWFSSYTYESPELYTLQDFQGFGDTCIEEVKKGKYGESQPVDKSNYGLLSAERKSSDKIIKHKESDEFEYSKSAALVTGSSESLSFSSEPPDIKNWFPSYLYEASPLGTAHDFTISDYKARENGMVFDVQKSCRKDKRGMMDFVDAEESIELPTQRRTSNLVAKCPSSTKDTKLDYQPVDKDVHRVGLMPMPSMICRSTSAKAKRTESSSLGSVEKLGLTNAYGKENDMKLDCSLSEKTIPKLLNMENNIGGRDGKYVRKSLGRKDIVEKEDVHETASPGALDLTVRRQDSWTRLADSRSIGKENKENELNENGFISTRNNSKENSHNSTRHVQVQFESLRKGVKPALRCPKNANMSRKVLSETSNFLSPGILESSGKWCCPQKKKPNLGPPLKQLRLEQWVRRV
ncbi:hypothetical protein OROGR_008274 [Orobanche gracilis]